MIDLRDFVAWIVADYEPALRCDGAGDAEGHYGSRPGEDRPALYGVADMACVLFAIGHLELSPERLAGWSAAFDGFRDPATGRYLESGSATHDQLHNTAFALSAMALLGLAPPSDPVVYEEHRDPASVVAFLDGLDWTTRVYGDSHLATGLASVIALTPDHRTPEWFRCFFDALHARFDPANGMLGAGKPPGGDVDQIGGTFHYHFLYEWFRRPMPHAEARIDAVIDLQEPGGLWFELSPLWVTLDAIHLMCRSASRRGYRRDDVAASVRRALDAVVEVAVGESARERFSGFLGAHELTATVTLLAEAQLFLGGDEVRTDRPLRSVLDHRPFI